MQKAVAQQLPRLGRDQVDERDDMLLRDRVGEIGVDPYLLHVRDDYPPHIETVATDFRPRSLPRIELGR